MGSCTGRNILLTICILQLVIVIECQVFDFMGFMYGPILANFLHIILLILGIFGAVQYSPRYIIVYSVWNILWIGWNIFVICFYLDAGILSKESDILNLGTGSRSWWEVHGFGCVAEYLGPAVTTSSSNLENSTAETSVIPPYLAEQDPDLSRPPRPSKVEGCFIQYQHIEVIQASIQCLLSLLAVMEGAYVSRSYLEEDDSSIAKTNQQRPALYSVEYNYQTSRRHIDQYQQQNGYGAAQVSPRPMTPRRVKRRSVQARDTMSRSMAHRRQGSSRARSSQRRTRPHQSPVTRLLEQQNRYLDSSVTSFNESGAPGAESSPLPLSDQDQETPHSAPGGRMRKSGLSNPVFQQSSNSSLNQSAGGDDVLRPQSARSSYSNYHASRPISYLHNNEYFSNQAVAQVPITTGQVRHGGSSPVQNNINVNTTTLKSFSHKNFNFLGFNLKHNNISDPVPTASSSGVNSATHSNSNKENEGVRNSKRFRVDLTRNTARASNSFFSQGPPAYKEVLTQNPDTKVAHSRRY